MKEITRLKFWQLLIAAVVIGGLCHFVFHWSVWATALFITFVWFAEKYSRWLYIPAVAIIFWALFTSYLPITSSKTLWATFKADLFIGKAVDSVQVKADLILEYEKNRQKEALLGQYAVLLREGKVEKAKRLMDSIDNLFYPKEIKEIPVAVQPTPPEQEVMLKDSIFTKGTYMIDVNGKTPFIINVKSPKVCDKYSLASQTGNGYDVLYADGTPPVHDAPNLRVTFPYKENPRFELASNQFATVKLVVN